MESQVSYNFVNAIRLTNVLSKTASKLIVQKLRNMNLFKSHAFFHYFFSNLIFEIVPVRHVSSPETIAFFAFTGKLSHTFEASPFMLQFYKQGKPALWPSVEGGIL